MTRIETIEIVWKSIDSFDPEILNNMFYGVLSHQGCLIKRTNGLTEYVDITTTETFKKEMQDDEWSTTNLATNSDRVTQYADILSYLDKHEIVIYKKEYFEEYGDYAGTETTIYDDVIEIALIPKSDSLDALINFNY